MKYHLIAILFFSVLVSGDEDGSRIVGGQNQVPGGAKYIVIIRNSITNAHVCSGSIIMARWVLTTASCIYKVEYNVYIEAGTVLLNVPGIRYDIEKPIPHRDYNPSSLQNNIGLLKTTIPIVFNLLVQPIDFPYLVPKNAQVLVSGWGLTSKTATNYPNNLQSITTQLINNTDCQRKYPAVTIFDSNYCTYTSVGEGMCMGDGGGPAIYRNQLAGMVSWGYPCAEGYPDVYTRVDSYLAWIDFATRIY